MKLVAEILRIDTPEQFVTRYVTEDIDVDGAILPTGAVVLLLIGSGNRDERAFPEPDVFRVDRPDVESRQLAFAGGQHGCAGQVLARAQGDIAISSFFRRFPTASLAAEPVFSHTEFIRGLSHLSVITG